MLISAPDIVLKKNKDKVVIEVKVCYVANTQKADDYKKKTYSDLRNDRIVDCENLRRVFLEVTSIGLILMANKKDFKELARELKLDRNRLIEKRMETVLRASY